MTRAPTQLFDPGLQPERTELAWRRSTLSLAVGSLISLRLLPPVLGLSGIALALVGLVAAGLLWILSRRRADLAQLALRRHTGLPGGRLLLGLTALVTGGAVVGLLFVALIHQG